MTYRFRPSADTSRGFSRTAFTVIELLIVVGIIAVLVSLLMPVLGRARAQAGLVTCSNNLRQIHAAMVAYAVDNDGWFPDGAAVGNFSYRMQPGLRTPNDPGALPETYGMAAVLHGIRPQQDLSRPTKPKYLDAFSDVWVCPGAIEPVQQYKNTYAFINLASGRSLSEAAKTPDAILVWDNDTLRPGLSGFRGPFSGYVITAKDRVYPHEWSGAGGRINELRNGGHVTTRKRP